MPAYKSTFPVTPFSPRYMDEQEAIKRLQEEQQANNIAAPFDADFSQMDAPLSPQVLDEREKLRQKLLEKKRNNPALNEALPKKFISKEDKDGPARTLPTQTKVPVQGSRPGRDSKIKDDGMGASSVSPTVGAKPNPFYAQGPNEPSLNLPEAPNVSAGVPNYLPPVGSSSSMPQQQGQQIGVVPRQQQEAEDPRAMLYARLLDRARNREMQDQDTLQRMGQARDMNALYQLAPILNQSASKMGTLQGKRSDVTDFQPLIKALGDRDMGPMMDEMNLRDEQDKRLLRQAEIASKLAKSQKGPTAPKVLPYYRPATKDQPGEILMYDQAGNLIPQQLPPGYEPNNPWSTLPMFQDASGRPVIIQQNPVTGETRKLELPDNLQALDQIKQQTQSRLAQLKLDMQVASEAQKNEMRREAARLSARMGEIREKEYMLRVRAQEEAERRNREREQIAKDKIGANGGAKRLSPNDLAKYGEGRDMGGVISNFRQSFDKYRSVIGPIKGRLGGVNPYDVNVQKFQADLKRAAQTIGKFMEGGVLRKEDEAKYEKMLPSLTDVPEVANYKLDQVDQMVRDRHKANLEALRSQGYDTSGLEMAPAAKSSPKTSKKVVDKFYDRKNNKTKFVYDDGTSEVVDGLR